MFFPMTVNTRKRGVVITKQVKTPFKGFVTRKVEEGKSCFRDISHNTKPLSLWMLFWFFLRLIY